MKSQYSPFVRFSSLVNAATIAFAASAQGAEVAGGNGNFEATDVSDMTYFGSSNGIYNGGFTSLEGWTFSGPGTVFLWLFETVNPYGPVIGNYSLNLTAGNGNQANAVSTTVTGLTPGQSYVLSFDTAARSGGFGTVTVKVDGASVGTFDGSVGTSYVSRAYAFTATGSSATLAFEYPGVTNNGYMLDNVAVIEAPPTDGIWTGADGNWSTAANWNANTIAQGVDKSATFNGLTPITATVDISRPIGSLIFSGANHTIAAGSGSLTLDGDTLFAPPSISVASGITATVSTLLGGTEGLEKIGDGALTLTAPPTYTGGTTVIAGTLRVEFGALAGNQSFSGPFSVDSGATLNLDNTNATVGGYYPGNFVLSGAGTLTKTNAGSIDLWNGSSLTGFTGTVDVQQGALRLNNITTGGNMPEATLNIASGATFDLRFNTTVSVDKLTGAGILDQGFNGGSGLSVTVGSNDGSSTFDGVIQNSSGQPLSLTKAGTGTLTLNGANTYTGSTTVSAGILSLSTASLNDNAPVVIGTDGKMDLNFVGSDVVSSVDIDGSGPLPPGTYDSSHPTYGSFFTGSGSLVVPSVSGNWISTNDGTWSDAANWASSNVPEGLDAIATFDAADASVAPGVTVTLDANRKVGNLAFAVSDYIIAGANTLTLDASSTIPAISVTGGRTATISANIAGNDGLEKTDAGTLVLTGSKSYTGTTTVTGGTLELSGGSVGNAQIHGSVQVNTGAILAFTNGDFTGFGFFNNPVTSITVDGGTINAVSGSHLGFGPAMTMALNNGGSLSGGWQWNGDALLDFTSSGDSTNTISGSVTLRPDVGADHTFFVDDGAAPIDLQINANLLDYSIGACNVVKTGTGTMVLNGANTYDGNTVVSDGTLVLADNAQLRFVVNETPASNRVTGSGTANFAGDFVINTAAVTGNTGFIWTLVDRGVLSSVSFDSTFSVVGFTDANDDGIWIMSDAKGDWSFDEASGELSLDVGNDYDDWATTNGVTGGETDDDDADGLTNFEEYAFGTDPTGGSSVNPIVVPLDKATGTFSYTRRATPATTGLSYSVWTSTDLGTWTEDSGATEGTIVTSGEVQTVPVTISSGLLSNSKLFIQVRAE